MKNLFTLSVLGLALSSVPAMGALLVFDDATAFINSGVVGTTPTATEAFNGGSSSLFTLTSAPTSTFVDIGGGDFVRHTRVVFGGYSELLTPIAGATVTGGTLVGPLTAWGASFDVTTDGMGQGLDLVVNHVGGTQTVISNINLREANPDGLFFLGVTVDGATPLISSITLRAANQNQPNAVAETFRFDNVIIEGAINADEGGGGSVPEPSTFGLMGLAMVGLGLARRLYA